RHRVIIGRSRLPTARPAARGVSNRATEKGMSYQQPGMYPPPVGSPLGPPPRRGRPWWVWALGGCAGCAVLALVASVIFGAWVVGNVQSAMKDVGPMDAASVQKRIGQDVPLYPGSHIETTTTQATAASLRIVEKVAGKQPGAIFRGVAALLTSDSADKVLRFYDQKLKAEGWRPTRTRSTSRGEQHAYQKGGEMVMIQAQEQPQGTMIIIMRGGPEVADKAPQQ
ncbi:MAG TPA: hypothetical protein VFU47_16000, partial [Armatimonadota bacterium]|nr:hypothetical protein [Armatimonadota bacterium]